MFRNIRNRLIIIIVSAIVFSIITVSFIIKYSIDNKFDNYLVEEQQENIDDILEIVKKIYEFDNKWSKESLTYLDYIPRFNRYGIVVKDKNNTVVHQHEIPLNESQQHFLMMNKMNKRKSNKFDEKIIRESIRTLDFDIIIDNNKVGTVTIGFLGEFKITESVLIFKEGINTSLIYAGLISITVAVLLGIYFSNYFSNPIKDITKAANDIREGKLSNKAKTKTNIIELQELKNSINILAESLENQQLLRKRLTSDISHELRTPLSILQSHLEAFSDGIWEPTKERLDKFNDEVSRLINLVEELKYLNDIENHKIILDKTNIDLSNLVEGNVENIRYQFENKNINLICNIEENIFYNGDKDKLNQILINILSNAKKYTFENGKVNVNLSKHDNKIELIIEDKGIGIPEEDIPFIFERLYRTDTSRNRKTGGAGIGLAITKTLVEAHNGNINVESEVNKGTKFVIIFEDNNEKNKKD